MLSDRSSALLVVATLFVYFLVGLAWISLPGLQQDEVLFVKASFPPTQVTWYGPKLQIFHWDIPTMFGPYLGAVKGLLWRGVFLFWAPSAYSARVPAVLLGGVALLLFYLWAKRFYPRQTALAALLLAATDPTYIFTVRLDWGPVVLAHLFGSAGLLLGTQWLGSGPDHDKTGAAASGLGWLAGAGVCFGLGLWDKATFFWFLLALAATLAILWPREVMRRIRPAACGVFLVSLLVGALPLVVYNVKPRGPNTAELVRPETADTAVIRAKLKNLQITLDGRSVYRIVSWENSDMDVASLSAGTEKLLAAAARFAPVRGTLLPWALLAAAAVAATASGVWRLILFPLLVSAGTWLLIVATKDAGFSAHHYSLAYPFPHLAVAAAGTWLWQRAGQWRRLGLILVFAGLLLSQLGWDARYLRLLRATGGVGNWSDAIYEVASYLEAHPPLRLINMDWGFSQPLLLLTHARLAQRDFYAIEFQEPKDERAHLRQLTPLLRQPNTLFLFHAGRFQGFPYVRTVFEKALEASGRRARPVRTFYQRNGETVIELMAVEPASQSP